MNQVGTFFGTSYTHLIGGRNEDLRSLWCIWINPKLLTVRDAMWTGSVFVTSCMVGVPHCVFPVSYNITSLSLFMHLFKFYVPGIPEVIPNLSSPSISSSAPLPLLLLLVFPRGSGNFRQWDLTGGVSGPSLFLTILLCLLYGEEPSLCTPLPRWCFDQATRAETFWDCDHNRSSFKLFTTGILSQWW